MAVQPDGLDPCDLRLKQGDGAVRELIARRQPVYEFAVRSELARHNLDTNEGRLAALDAAAPIIARIKDRGLRDRYAVSLDRWLGLLNEEFVLARIRAAAGSGGPGRGNGGSARGQRDSGRRDPGQRQVTGARAAPSTEAPRYNASEPVVNVERQALKLAVQRPALCGPVFDALPPDGFTVPVHQAVREIISGCGGVASAKSARDWATQLIAAAPNDRAREFVTRLAVEPIETPRKDGEPDARYAEAVLAQVEDLTVSRQIAELKSRLQRLSPVERQDYNRTFGDLVALEQRHKTLMGRASGAL